MKNSYINDCFRAFRSNFLQTEVRQSDRELAHSTIENYNSNLEITKIKNYEKLFLCHINFDIL